MSVTSRLLFRLVNSRVGRVPTVRQVYYLTPLEPFEGNVVVLQEES